MMRIAYGSLAGVVQLDGERGIFASHDYPMDFTVVVSILRVLSDMDATGPVADAIFKEISEYYAPDMFAGEE